MKETIKYEKCHFCTNGKSIMTMSFIGGGVIREIHPCAYCEGTGKMKITVKDYTK